MFRLLISFLAAAVLSAAALAQSQPKGAATSLELNRHGVGHMLVVPYFNTQGGNATLLNLSNTNPSRSKAVKIRFRSAGNGDELFSLQVFLRGQDAWAVNISTGVDGLPVLTTADRSCTLPAVINGEKFSTARLNPTLTGDALANQTREGYIEILAMGDLIQGTALWWAINHMGGTPPCTASTLGALARFDAQLAPPTTGLMANWLLINVPQTTTWAGEAVAYEARLDGAASTGNVVYFPQTAAPLTAADVTSYTADPLYNFSGGGPTVAPVSSNLPDLSTPYTSTGTSPQDQATELSFDIAAQETVVEYLTAPTILASTDWVLSMPTRRYHAAVDYRGPMLVTNRETFGDAGAVYFPPPNAMSSTGQSCYRFFSLGTIRAADREGTSTISPVISPALPWSYQVCGMVSVLSVNGAEGASSPTLQAAVTRWRLAEPQAGSDGSAYLTWPYAGNLGLPALIRQFSRAVNPEVAPGVSGTFGATWPGRTLIPGVAP